MDKQNQTHIINHVELLKDVDTVVRSYTTGIDPTIFAEARFDAMTEMMISQVFHLCLKLLVEINVLTAQGMTDATLRDDIIKWYNCPAATATTIMGLAQGIADKPNPKWIMAVIS